MRASIIFLAITLYATALGLRNYRNRRNSRKALLVESEAAPVKDTTFAEDDGNRYSFTEVLANLRDIPTGFSNARITRSALSGNGTAELPEFPTASSPIVKKFDADVNNVRLSFKACDTNSAWPVMVLEGFNSNGQYLGRNTTLLSSRKPDTPSAEKQLTLTNACSHFAAGLSSDGISIQTVELNKQVREIHIYLEGVNYYNVPNPVYAFQCTQLQAN